MADRYVSSERVIGYVQSTSVRRGSTVYVTTERIIVNRSRGQLSLRAHLLTALLVAVAPYVPATVAVALILGIVAIISTVSVKNRRARKKWPTIKDVEEGVRLFEVNKSQVLIIEIKRPGRLRRGYVRITSLSSEVFDLKIARGKAFGVANSLMMRFQPDRVRTS